MRALRFATLYAGFRTDNALPPSGSASSSRSVRLSAKHGAPRVLLQPRHVAAERRVQQLVRLVQHQRAHVVRLQVAQQAPKQPPRRMAAAEAAPPAGAA